MNNLIFSVSDHRGVKWLIFLQVLLRSLHTESFLSIHNTRITNLSAKRHGLSTSSANSPETTPREIDQDPTSIKKASLFKAISNFNAIKERDGTVPIDFGVKGGELDSETRAPTILNFYTISDDLGSAANGVFSAIDNLVETNTDNVFDATRFLGTAEGALCPLHGAWVNKFTNAADATFSSNSTRGDADVYNVVDGIGGSIWNVIDFKKKRNNIKKKSPLRQLCVKLSATAVSSRRVELVFRFVKIHLNRWPILPIRKRATITIPVPGPFLTRILFFFRRSKKPPPAYFDVLYLDDDLRIHRTGQGAYFVQARPEWSRVL